MGKGKQIRQTPTNVSNFLKLPEGGFKRWRPQLFFAGYHKDGSVKTVEGFKNTLTDREVTPVAGWNADLDKLDHGDLSNVQHAGDAYRRGYEQIRWDR